MEASEWTGGRRILAPRGKTLGGSSSINGHIYNRGQRMDYDTWAQMGNRGWGYADVLPYFRRMERRLGDGDPTYRGRDGSLTVSDLDWRHPLCEAFLEGAVQLGIPRNPDYNGAIQECVAYAQRTINNGRRVSAATAFCIRAGVQTCEPCRTPRPGLEGKRASVPTSAAAAATTPRARPRVITPAPSAALLLSGVGRRAPIARHRCARSPAWRSATTTPAFHGRVRTSTPSTSAPGPRVVRR
jgi:choline dehydrogenase-like flavoprotein